MLGRSSTGDSCSLKLLLKADKFHGNTHTLQHEHAHIATPDSPHPYTYISTHTPAYIQAYTHARTHNALEQLIYTRGDTPAPLSSRDYFFICVYVCVCVRVNMHMVFRGTAYKQINVHEGCVLTGACPLSLTVSFSQSGYVTMGWRLLNYGGHNDERRD